MNNSYLKNFHKSEFSRITYDNCKEELIKLLKGNSNHGLCGSQNLGNTCFMNSSIACISNCYELTYFFLSGLYKKYINRSNKEGTGGQLAEGWAELIKYYWNSTIDYGNPKIIKNLVGSKNRKFSSYNQQDSNEFMTVFLEILGEDLNKAKKKVYRELKEQQKNETEVMAAKRFWDLHVERNDNIITDLFHGLFKCTITCPNCDFKNITYDPFNTLALTIPDARTVNALREKQLRKKKKKIIEKIKEKDKYEVSIFYVPEYSLRSTVHYKIQVYKGKSLNEISQEIKQRKTEHYSFSINSKYFCVGDKKCDNILDSKVLFKIKNHTFAYANIPNNAYCIPVYLSFGDDLSAYPRALYVNSNDSFYELKKKIYILVRKYFMNLFSEMYKNDKFVDDINLERYINEHSNNLQGVIHSLETEYNNLQKNWNLLHISDKNIPYYIYISDNFKIINKYLISSGIKNNFQILSQLNIRSNNDKIETLIKTLINNEIFLSIKLNSESKFVNKNIQLNKCVTDICQPISEKEYEKYYQEIEKMDIDDDNDSENPYIKSRNITLNDCLQYFSDIESLEKGNEWHCNRCKRNVMALKQIELFYLPRILCICLTRFLKGRYRYTKNSQFVEFPIENLNMENYMSGPDKQYSKYDLFAVSQHYGDMGGGHYTAVCKNIDEKWYDYDDSDCSPTSKNNIVTSAAYVLFYRRKGW